jgi:hypothetical protein
MGCDIHSVAQKYINGEWVDVSDGSILDFENNEFGYEPFLDVAICMRICIRSEQYYNIYAFLAGVCNRNDIKPISTPRGFPKDLYQVGQEIRPDVSDILHAIFDNNLRYVSHSPSWLSVTELKDFPYDSLLQFDLSNRTSNYVPEAALRELTYREFLGKYFFKELNKLIELEADRIVFGFDN